MRKPHQQEMVAREGTTVGSRTRRRCRRWRASAATCLAVTFASAWMALHPGERATASAPLSHMDRRAAALQQDERALAACDSVPAGARSDDAERQHTNQQVIDAFYQGARRLGRTDDVAWGWLVSAGLAHIAGDRPAAYAGPDIMDLPNLPDAVKRAVAARLEAMPLLGVARILSVPWVSQLDARSTGQNDCGQACVLMLAHAYGKVNRNMTVDDLATLRPGRTDAAALRDLAARFDLALTVDETFTGVDSLRRLIDQGKPVAVLVNYEDLHFPPHLSSPDQGWHWLLVVGYRGDDQFIVHDPLWRPDQRDGRGGAYLRIARDTLQSALAAAVGRRIVPDAGAGPDMSESEDMALNPQGRAAALSPDGRLALTTSADADLLLWDRATGERVRCLDVDGDFVNSVAFSPDGRTALAGSCAQRNSDGDCVRGDITLWDAARGARIRVFEPGHPASVLALAFSPDGRTALSGAADMTLALWSVERGARIRVFDPEHTAPVLSVAFSPDGQTALSGSDDTTVILWDVAEGKALRTFSGHQGGVSSVAFSPDGQTALSGAYDGALILWDIETGDPLKTFEGRVGAANLGMFGLDGQTLLAASGDGVVTSWDLRTGDPLWALAGPGIADWYGVAFSADARMALFASQTHERRVWWVDPLEERASPVQRR